MKYANYVICMLINIHDIEFLALKMTLGYPANVKDVALKKQGGKVLIF